MKKYKVNKEIFRVDCLELAKRINSGKGHKKDFIPEKIIAINNHGLKVAHELRKHLDYKNLSIEEVIIDEETGELKKGLDNLDFNRALIVTGLLDTGETLNKALIYLESLSESYEKDIDALYVTLYDLLKVKSPYYTQPNYWGIAFTSECEIDFKI